MRVVEGGVLDKKEDKKDKDTYYGGKRSTGSVCVPAEGSEEGKREKDVVKLVLR